MRTDTWVPMYGTNGKQRGMEYLDPARVLEHTLRHVGMDVRRRDGNEIVPAADVVEADAAVTISIDLPGHAADGIELNLDAGVLTVRSERPAPADADAGRARRVERRFGTFVRSFALHRDVDPERIEASYDDGVLTITLPKREEAKPRTIPVKARG